MGYKFTSKAATGGTVSAGGSFSRRSLGPQGQYAIDNALRWYRYANQHLDREIPNGASILVTGCNRAVSWGFPSFSGVSSDLEVELSFKSSCGRTYLWETNIVSATVRTSLGHQPTSALNRVRDPITELASHNVDARHGTCTQIGGNRINIMNMAPTAMGDRCKL